MSIKAGEQLQLKSSSSIYWPWVGARQARDCEFYQAQLELNSFCNLTLKNYFVDQLSKWPYEKLTWCLLHSPLDSNDSVTIIMCHLFHGFLIGFFNSLMQYWDNNTTDCLNSYWFIKSYIERYPPSGYDFIAINLLEKSHDRSVQRLHWYTDRER